MSVRSTLMRLGILNAMRMDACRETCIVFEVNDDPVPDSRTNDRTEYAQMLFFGTARFDGAKPFGILPVN